MNKKEIEKNKNSIFLNIILIIIVIMFAIIITNNPKGKREEKCNIIPYGNEIIKLKEI